MINYYVARDGESRCTTEFDPSWLRPDSGVVIWADVQNPDAPEAERLRTEFGFHPLAVEDALQAVHLPKIEPYPGFIYIVLHGIDFHAEHHAFETLDIDFFLGANFLVTVHDGRRRSVGEVADICTRNQVALREGPVGVMHRIVDRMVDHYRPEVDELESRLDEIEQEVLQSKGGELTGEILAVKRDITSMRRIIFPQRDIVGRLARREFEVISQEMAYRFRDVYDHLVRLADETVSFQDRVTGILDAHLAAVSNRLATVSKFLAGLAVMFGPLTIVTGLYGMNVTLPVFPGGDAAQFWWVLGGMVAITGAILLVFRRQGWL